LFSRTKAASSEESEALIRAAASTQTKAVDASMPPIIREIKDVPQGRIITDEIGMPADWKSYFAVLEVQGGSVDVLVSEKMFGSAAMFDLVRRMAAKGLVKRKILRATEDIVVLINDRSKSQKAEAMATSDVTDIEQKARWLIDAAVEAGASDIHIETRGSHADVYFRIHGMRHFHSNISMETARSMGVVLYSVHADASSKEVTWDSQQVMDAVIDHISRTGQSVQLRFSSAPIYPSGNFHIVIRVLTMDGGDAKNLASLGYEEAQLAALDTMITGSSGMVILCGPTNSGKSTTLQAMMRRIYERRGNTIKLLSVEDPVEYTIPGACQIGVARKRKTVRDEGTGSAFTTFLRGTLRQDPDVVMVGEIRDHESAAVVKDLVLTGRKLLTTLHTYSAMWAFVRLREIGVPMSLMTMPGFISGIVYQRLVPTLCPHCSVPLADPNEQHRLDPDVMYRVQQVVDLASHSVRVKGDGCPHCNHTGISGRTICAEFVMPDQKMLKMISEERYIEAQEYWRNAGVLSVDGIGVTALSHAIAKMRRGLIDPADVEHQVGMLTHDIVTADSMLLPEEMPILTGVKQLMGG